MAPWQLLPVTVPESLPQVVGGCAIMVTATGGTVYGVFSLIAMEAEYVPGWSTFAVMPTVTVTFAPGASVTFDLSTVSQLTSAAPAAHSEKPGRTSLSLVAVKPPDEPPIL